MAKLNKETDRKGFLGNLRGTVGLETETVKPEKKIISSTSAETDEIKTTLLLDKPLFEMIEREAYWERTTNKVVIKTALEEYFKNKKYEPIPEGKHFNKRGRKRA